MDEFDLIIIGGGMAGLSLVAGLEPAIQDGLKVALVDPAPQPTDSRILSPSFDDRATALSAQTLISFKELGLANLEQAITPIRQIEVSDKGHTGYHLMDAKKHGHRHFGAVIANKTLGNLLWQRCKNVNVKWLFNASVEKITPIQNGQKITLIDGQQLQTTLAILCDGGRSTLHKQLGVPSVDTSFNASARVATVSTQRPHNGKAFERFTADGPIALLPFGEFSTLVWTIPESKKAHYPNSSEDALAWLNRDFGQRLGQLTAIGNWLEYPLIERQITQSAGHGFLILGNAAATLHPVAGQGFNLALRGIVRTADCLNRFFMTERKLPNFAQLSLLSATIAQDQKQTATFSRELIRLFGSTSVIAQLARGAGLNSLDRHPLFSQSFALATMGLLENTPSLLPSVRNVS